MSVPHRMSLMSPHLRMSCATSVLLLSLLSLPCLLAKPNVVLFYADDFGYGDLPAYGHPTSQAPNLDVLFRDGALMTQFYVSTALCTPSRSSLMTGRYPVKTGIWPGNFGPGSIGGLPHNETTIAEVLKNASYATAHVGKWHLGIGENFTYLPHNQGFDSYFGIPYSNDMCPCYVCFFPHQPCPGNDTCNPGSVPCPIIEAVNGTAKVVEQPADLTTLSAQLTEKAVDFVTESILTDRPFFLYYAFHHTHHPQFSGKAFRNTSARGDFGDSIAEMDGAVGEVMHALKSQTDNTIVIFASDNGPCLLRELEGGNGGALKCGKGTTYEGGTRVPALFHWPGHIPARRCLELGSTLDVLPTVAGLAGVSLSPDVKAKLNGFDLSGMLLNPNLKSPRDYMLYFPPSPDPAIGMYALRYNNYKAFYFTEGSRLSGPPYIDGNCSAVLRAHVKPLLFDLSIDPSESYNINEHPGSEEILARMREVKVQKEIEIGRWAPSQTTRGNKNSLQPCCKPGCTPFPSCCTCSHTIRKYVFHV